MRPPLVLLAAVLALAGCGSSNAIQVPSTASQRCQSAASQYQTFQQALGRVLRDPSDATAGGQAGSAAERLKTTLAEFVPHANVHQQAALSQFRLELTDFRLQLDSAARGDVSTAKPLITALGRELTALRPLVETLCKR